MNSSDLLGLTAGRVSRRETPSPLAAPEGLAHGRLYGILAGPYAQRSGELHSLTKPLSAMLE